MFKLDLEKAEDQWLNRRHLLDHRKSKRVPEKHLLLLYLFIFFQVLKLFICILKKLCIPIIKIIWTTKKMALWLNCILQPAEHLGPAFYSRFHCRPTQLPPSSTCKFFSFPASHTGRWERQARPTLSVALYSLMWKGVAQSFKLDPTSLHLTKLNS